MKPMIVLALSITSILVASCGIGEKEKAALLQAQQAKDDSIRVADIKLVKQTEAMKTALGDSLAYYNNLLSRQENNLIQNRALLYTANDEMTQIKAFHVGRLPQTREDQVRDQELKIQTLGMQQASLQMAIQHNIAEIDRLKTQLSYLK